MRSFTIYFCYVSNEARRTVPLVDDSGNEITLQVTADTKTAAIYHPDVAAFCLAQGNDCRVRRVI